MTMIWADRDPETAWSSTLFSKVVIGLIASVPAFANPARGADAEERILTGQEKAAVLAEIAERFREFPSIGLNFVFRQLNEGQTEEETLGSEHHIVLDDHRYYVKDADESFQEYSWDGSEMRSFHSQTNFGSIRGEVKVDGYAGFIFPMFGRDASGQSWLTRYENRESDRREYDVAIDAETARITVVEEDQGSSAGFTRQAFEFDPAKAYAITRYLMDIVYKNKNETNVERIIDMRFEDHRLVNGFHIPFKTIRTATIPEWKKSVVQTIIVNDATVNDDSHEQFLSGIEFPRGASISTDSWFLELRLFIGQHRQIVSGLFALGLLIIGGGVIWGVLWRRSRR